MGSAFDGLLGQDIGNVRQGLKVAFSRAIQGVNQTIVPDGQ